jgi:predicted CoA-binding protein
MKKTLVIGASENPERYSYKATEALKKHKHEVIALGLKDGEINGTKIITGYPILENIDTVTLYVGPKNQPAYFDYVLSLKPKRVVFNPGTENEEFENLLTKNGIEAERACTLVLLSLDQY